MALDILYPNGKVEAVLTYILVGGIPIPWDGSISVVSTGSAIDDGVDGAIEASVIDYISGGGATKKNPLAVQLTDLDGDPTLSLIVNGGIASGDADSGNPVKIGLLAKSSLPAAQTAGDRLDLIGDLTGRALIRAGHQSLASNYWDVQHVPAANTQATISQASAGSGKRNVCTGFTLTICGGSTAPAAWQGTVAIIDGSTGGGTYLWRSNISIPAVAGAVTSFIRSNIWLVGSQATALTAEFSGAGGANTYQSVTMEGTTIEE